MNLAGKITFGASVLVIGGLAAVAAPAVASIGRALTPIVETAQAAASAEPTTNSRPGTDGTTAWDTEDHSLSQTVPAKGPAGCAAHWLNLGNGHASVGGDLTDRGEQEFARGTVGLDANGKIKTYTVAAGDVAAVIGDRFCITNGLSIPTLNHTRVIQPGEVLLIAPDASIPWVEYFNPRSAGDGYQQIPYQRAVERMSDAAHSGDIDRMRSTFENELRALYPDPAEAEPIQQALDAGNLDVLRQMFA